MAAQREREMSASACTGYYCSHRLLLLLWILL